MKKLSIVSVFCLIVIASIGIFSSNVADVATITNIFGESVTLYGKGIYGHETTFRAGILIGTDIVMLFVITPLFIMTQIRKQTVGNQVLTLGILGVIIYYSLVTVLSIRYNQFYLLYVILFTCSLYHFIYLMIQVPIPKITNNLTQRKAPKGVTIYLIFAGISVFVWLVEILANVVENTAPMHIGTLHTEPTYLIDLAIIPPTCFIARHLIKKENGLGIVLANVMAIISLAIAAIVISQSAMQIALDVLPDISQVVIYVCSFLILSIFSAYYVIRMKKLLH